MSDATVREIDRLDEGQLRAWWEIGAEVAAERPYDVWLPWENARRAHVVPDANLDTVLLGAFRGDRLVGAAWLGMPRQDNTHLLFPDLMVAPGLRGGGVGAALLADTEWRARAVGRTTLLSAVHAPVGAENDGTRFATAQGFSVAGTAVIKVADLRATEATWPALAEGALSHLSGYTLVWWAHRAPEEHVDGLAALYGRLLGEIPTEEADFRPQVWDAERVRAVEARRVETGRAHLLVAAVAPDGTLVGYSNLTVDSGEPDRADIDATLVLPEHRGHRLGLAMKVRLHQLTREHLPGVTQVVTGNAGINAPMNAVNDLLGYRVVERLLEMQKVL